MSVAVGLRTRTNAAMAASLRGAAAALVELDRAGCQVHACVIRDGRPVLLIEQPTAPLCGAVSLRSSHNGKRQALWCADIAGCRVEWAAPDLQAVAPA